MLWIDQASVHRYHHTDCIDRSVIRIYVYIDVYIYENVCAYLAPGTAAASCVSICYHDTIVMLRHIFQDLSTVVCYKIPLSDREYNHHFVCDVN